MVVSRLTGPFLETFDEDLRASWVPDVLAWADAELRLGDASGATSMQAIEWIPVPKPDGTSFRAPLIPLPWLAVLSRAVEPLKDAAADVLAPTVCGYRRGAEPGAAYSAEHRRFTEIVRAEAAESAFVVSADVRRFFAATSWATVMGACARALPSASTAPLGEAVDGFQRAGLTHLPAGYADARFLANIVLIEADRAIGLPFARWVDDYRIFAPNQEAADAALGRLAEALAQLGLMLNVAKARRQPAMEYLDSCGASFTSVYHPEFEASEVVRAALRTVFLNAAPDPRAHRRSLRFVLPRLAAEGDEIAVEWALEAFGTTPWEAPRLVAYLAAFAENPAVRSGVKEHLLLALRLDDVWLATRLAALACSTGIPDDAVDAVAGALTTTESPALWGCLLRALALAGEREAVVQELQRRVLDPRGAVGACADLGLRGVLDFTEEMERTAHALGGRPAPPPSLDTIL
jgi:hypothetical protein